MRVPREKIPPEAPFTTRRTYPVSGWTTRNPDEKIVPAREHSRLTNRKSTDAALGRSFAVTSAHMDGQKMKENKDAL
jgi:hypothetical protein